MSAPTRSLYIAYVMHGQCWSHYGVRSVCVCMRFMWVPCVLLFYCRMICGVGTGSSSVCVYVYICASHIPPSLATHIAVGHYSRHSIHTYRSRHFKDVWWEGDVLCSVRGVLVLPDDHAVLPCEDVFAAFRTILGTPHRELLRGGTAHYF